jgi:hypothetical protein
MTNSVADGVCNVRQFLTRRGIRKELGCALIMQLALRCLQLCCTVYKKRAGDTVAAGGRATRAGQPLAEGPQKVRSLGPPGWGRA